MKTNSSFVTLLYMVYRCRVGLRTLRLFSWSVFGVVLGVATLLSRLHTRGTVQSLQEFTAVRVLEDASGWIRAAAWSQNLLATAGDDKTVRIYDSDQDREGEVPVRNSKLDKHLLKHQELEGVGSCHFHRYSSCHLD